MKMETKMKRRDFLAGVAAVAIVPSLPPLSALPEAAGPGVWVKKVSEFEWEIVLPEYDGFVPNAYRVVSTSGKFEVIQEFTVVRPPGGWS